MTRFAPLNNWESTRDSLHYAAQVVGRVRKLFIAPQPNALHLSLRVVPEGLATGPLDDGHHVLLDFVNQQIHSTFLNTPQPLSLESLAALEARAHAIRGSTPPQPEAPTQFAVDTAIAAAYARSLYRIFTAMARFKAGLGGRMSPAVVWPHHFDLSFLYFIGDGHDEHKDPHMNFGFAPFSATIDRPYVYFYAWPMPEGINSAVLPAPAQWFQQDWTGIIIEYDTLVDEDDPEAVIEACLRGIFDLFEDAMHGV